MPYALNLSHFLKEAIPKTISIASGASQGLTPQHGRRWLIVGGIMNHITLTLTILQIYKGGGSVSDSGELVTCIGVIHREEAATISGKYPLVTNIHPLQFIEDDEKLVLDGDGGASAFVRVLEANVV